MIKPVSKPPPDSQKIISSRFFQVAVTLFLMLLLFGGSAFIAFQTGKVKVDSGNQANECVVGGCNNEICSEKSEEPQASICIYNPKFECYKSAVCEKQADGKCGWTTTDELSGCLVKSGSDNGSSEGKFCGGIAGISCPEGYSCKLDGKYPDAGGKCAKN